MLDDAEFCGEVLCEEKMTEIEAKDKAYGMPDCTGFTYSKRMAMPAMITFAGYADGKEWAAAKGWRSWQKAKPLPQQQLPVCLVLSLYLCHLLLTKHLSAKLCIIEHCPLPSLLSAARR